MKNIKWNPNIFRNLKMGDFIRNFAAVVLGIVITFAFGDLIAERNAQNQVREAMQLVKIELIENRSEIEQIRDRELYEQQAVRYIFQKIDSIELMPQDSLLKYASAPFQLSDVSYTQDAMDMLKSSGLIQNIKEKKLALKLIKTYDKIRSGTAVFEWFVSSKKSMQERMFVNPVLLKNLVESSSPVEMIKFMFCYPEGKMLLQYIVNCHDPKYIYDTVIESIDATVAAIDAEYELE